MNTFARLTCLPVALLIWLVGLPACAQPYQNLVLEGGGVRGIAYGGALRELDAQGQLDGLIRVGGTSAGAIQATLLAVGFRPDEIVQLTYQTPIRSFNDGRGFFIGAFFRINRHYGWYRGERFRRWIGARIAERTGAADLTLGELHARAGQNGYRDLYLTATDLTQQRVVVLSHETFPDLPLRDAVRISMSIPFYYRAVFMNDAGQGVRRRAEATHVLADGGIVANYPIDLFDDRRYLPMAAPDDSGYVWNPTTLGLRLDRPAQMAYDQQGHGGLAPYPIHRLRDYVGAFYTFAYETMNRRPLSACDEQRTVSISHGALNPRVRRLSKAEKTQLIHNGEAGVITFFASPRR